MPRERSDIEGLITPSSSPQSDPFIVHEPEAIISTTFWHCVLKLWRQLNPRELQGTRSLLTISDSLFGKRHSTEIDRSVVWCKCQELNQVLSCSWFHLFEVYWNSSLCAHNQTKSFEAEMSTQFTSIPGNSFQCFIGDMVQREQITLNLCRKAFSKGLVLQQTEIKHSQSILSYPATWGHILPTIMYHKLTKISKSHNYYIHSFIFRTPVFLHLKAHKVVWWSVKPVQGPVTGPLEKGGLGFAVTETWCGPYQVWRLSIPGPACRVTACHITSCFKFCDAG